jgi:c-di-GMP-binding flagellar brake protein YcgR
MLEEKRAQYRLQMDLPVLYKASKHQTATTTRAITCNISASGICLYTGILHKRGAKLQVMLQHVFDSPKTCTVIWRSKKYHDLYKTGVRFLQDIL